MSDIVLETQEQEAATYHLRDEMAAEISFGDESDPLERLSADDRQEFKRYWGIQGKTHWDDPKIPRGHFRTMAGRIKTIKSVMNAKSKRGLKRKSPEEKKWSTYRGKALIGTGRDGKETYLVAAGEQILILQDTYRDGVVCTRCDGAGHLFMTCTECMGTKKTSEGVCQGCLASSYERPEVQPTGKRQCPDCQDKNGIPTGVKAKTASGIIGAKSEKEELPSTGVVVSVGDKVSKWKLQDRVMFSQFSGQQIKVQGNIYRMMSQSYPIGQIFGTADVESNDLTEYKQL